MTAPEPLFSYGSWSGSIESAVLLNGTEKRELRLHRADSVHIVPVLPDGRILLLKEYRPFLQDFVWMIPSGKADHGKTIPEEAQRELREESGHRARVLRPMCSCFSTDAFAFTHHFFIGEDLIEDPLPLEEVEHIEVFSHTFADALDLVLKQKHVHLHSAYALTQYLRLRAA